MKFIIDARYRTAFAHTLLTMPNSEINTSIRRIHVLDDVIQAVKDIYYHPNTLWAHAREGRGIHKPTSVAPFNSRVETLLNNIGEIIFNYFNLESNTVNNQINFDEFHEILCDTFLSGINTIRASAGLSDMSYGQAQKLINLTFKYLTTYSDYLDFADLFSYCHMVIDAIVLGNLSRTKISRILGVRPTNRVIHLSGSGFNSKGWTAFSKEDYLSLVQEYRNMIDPYLGDNTYMQIEYHMWPTYSLIGPTGTYAAPIARFYK